MHLTDTRDATTVLPTSPTTPSKALIIESKHTYKLTDAWEQPRLNGDPHSVKIRVVAVGLNTIDYKSVDYNFNLPQFPWTIGREASGVVVEAGQEASKDISIGDRVWVSTYYKYIDGGVFQEYIVVPSHTVLKIPSTITFDKAASLGVTALTSSMTLFHYFDTTNTANEGDGLLVWGGSTVTAQFTIQLAVRAGLKVYGVASESNLELVRGLGATAISRTDKSYDDIVDEVRRVSGDTIKYVVDLIGVESSNAALKLLKYGGAIAPLASMTLGKEAHVPDGVQVHIIEMKRFILDSTYRWHGEHLNQLIQSNELHFPSIEILSGFESIQGGLERLKQGNMNGKKLVVLL